MILRRLAAAIAGQNWVTVILEVVIVVVGIFLGLQASEWSQNREDRRNELVYLERISADFDASMIQTNSSREFRTRHARYGALVLEALRKCDLPSDQRDQFASGIYLVAKHSTADFVQATLQELLSAGRLTIIRNSSVRQMLVEMMQAYDDHLFYMSDVQLRVAPHVNYIDSVAPIVVDSAISGGVDVTWDMLDADFEELCGDRRFYTAMAASINYTWDSTDSLIVWGKRLSNAKSEIEAELERLGGSTR
jgi:hypothetical protein